MVKVTNSILDKILNDKQQEVENLKKVLPLEEVREYIDPKQVPVNFSGALMGDTIRLIAEIKKASPSKGMLDPKLDPVIWKSINFRPWRRILPCCRTW